MSRRLSNVGVQPIGCPLCVQRSDHAQQGKLKLELQRAGFKPVGALALIFGMLLIGQGAVAMAQKPTKDEAIVKKVIQLAQREDASTAFAHLESHGTPTQVAGLYSTLVKRLYSNKDVPRMILFARAGIHYALAQSAKAKAKPAGELKGLAKTMAYNLGSNTWPGWKDPGIAITATDLSIGLDAAKTNLRLGIELKRDDFILGNAHWLVGAQQLANGEQKQAVASFKKAASKFRVAKKTDFALMSNGYVALANLASAPSASKHADALKAALDKLKQAGSEDAKFFAKQIRTAKSMFVKRKR